MPTRRENARSCIFMLSSLVHSCTLSSWSVTRRNETFRISKSNRIRFLCAVIRLHAISWKILDTLCTDIGSGNWINSFRFRLLKHTHTQIYIYFLRAFASTSKHSVKLKRRIDTLHDFTMSRWHRVKGRSTREDHSDPSRLAEMRGESLKNRIVSRIPLRNSKSRSRSRNDYRLASLSEI